jgi:hypothetical protein
MNLRRKVETGYQAFLGNCRVRFQHDFHASGFYDGNWTERFIILKAFGSFIA